ncbi:PREDICTED: Williams-Beuren syndrome chromosomal region 27 protein-like [Branchiostoma belcheri]|uniref:Williams-Beuren syndrome chromosomal region 27 protein-like n=1 Tax=Branchiostoma belcheri TaxID=7741 RepID=A0A6P4ZSY6_BRABE|nr:PREDICTED: Williams-Beuren syndrome chromosomal region 27 protein-like [Branchiostoma belcheri]
MHAENIMAGLPLWENSALSQLKDGMAADDMVACYDSFAERYDEETAKRDYTGPRLCAEALAKWLGDRKTSRILDVAAGTGLCAMELRKLRFTLIDGLDPSQGSLDYARSKNRYDKYICDFIGANRLDIEDASAGGYICITTRNVYLTTVEAFSGGKLEAAMMELQTKGFWEQVSIEVVPEYHPGVDAVIFVFKVLR